MRELPRHRSRRALAHWVVVWTIASALPLSAQIVQTSGSQTFSSLSVPSGANTSGSYTLGGTGSLAISSGDLDIGNSPGTSGTFNFNTQIGDAATLSFTGAGQNLVVGGFGAGVFNQGGGTLNLDFSANPVILAIGGSQVGGANGVGQYNLSGGSLNASTININSGSSLNATAGAIGITSSLTL